MNVSLQNFDDSSGLTCAETQRYWQSVIDSYRNDITSTSFDQRNDWMGQMHSLVSSIKRNDTGWASNTIECQQQIQSLLEPEIAYLFGYEDAATKALKNCTDVLNETKVVFSTYDYNNALLPTLNLNELIWKRQDIADGLVVDMSNPTCVNQLLSVYDRHISNLQQRNIQKDVPQQSKSNQPLLIAVFVVVALFILYFTLKNQ